VSSTATIITHLAGDKQMHGADNGLEVARHETARKSLDEIKHVLEPRGQQVHGARPGSQSTHHVVQQPVALEEVDAQWASARLGAMPPHVRQQRRDAS